MNMEVVFFFKEDFIGQLYYYNKEKQYLQQRELAGNKKHFHSPTGIFFFFLVRGEKPYHPCPTLSAVEEFGVR